MRRNVLLPLGHFGLLLLLPACQQVRQAGAALFSGTGYVTRPVISGSRKLAAATLTGGRRAADATVSGTRAVASATAASGRKVASVTISGAKSIAAGATRLVTFRSAVRQPSPAPLTPAKPPGNNEPSLPAPHAFPNSGLIVTDAELGPDATRLETTAVNLGGGWVLGGTSAAYRLPPGSDDPTALLVKGSPATARLDSENTVTTASASEIHYHAANQVLTLKGNPILASGTIRVAATAATTQIRLHLPTGAISILGPARWGE